MERLVIMDPLGECAKTSVDNGKAHVTIPDDFLIDFRKIFDAAWLQQQIANIAKTSKNCYFEAFAILANVI